MYEELISKNDNEQVYDYGRFFITSKKKLNYKKVSKSFSYNSSNNPNFYSIKDLKRIISKTAEDA